MKPRYNRIKIINTNLNLLINFSWPYIQHFEIDLISPTFINPPIVVTPNLDYLKRLN